MSAPVSQRKMKANYIFKEDEIWCNFRSPTGGREPYIDINKIHDVKVTIDDVSGSILFDGYWYTNGYYDNRYSGEESWTEHFDPPEAFQFQYAHYSKDFISTHQEKFKPFNFRGPQGMVESTEEQEQTMYVYPCIEEIVAEVEVYERSVLEDTSGEGEYDEELGGRIVFFPTQINLLKFRVVKRAELNLLSD